MPIMSQVWYMNTEMKIEDSCGEVQYIPIHTQLQTAIIRRVPVVCM